MLKIGPLRIGLAAPKARALPTEERGAPGAIVSRFGRRGSVLIPTEVDYLADMQPPTRWTTVAKMLADDAIAGAYRAMVLPCLSAPLLVEPGTRDTVGREMADFVKADLDGMSAALQRHRREALGFLADGVRVFEKVFEVREDGLIHLRNLALRPNGSITEWLVDERGGPRGVMQLGLDYQEIELEIARLLIFTHEQEGANLTGRSVFRAAYKAWWYKDQLERIAAIAAERGAVGVPVGTQTGDDEDLAAGIEDVLQGVRAHQEGFIREIEGRFKFRIEGLTGDRVDPLPLLEHFRRGAFVSVLADFLALGDGSAGSWALSRDKSSFFVMALGAILHDMEDTYNRHLIAPWVRANWGDVPAESLPRVTHGPLNTRDVAEWFGAVTGAVEKGVLSVDERLQDMARDILGIPELPEEAPEPQTEAERAADQPNAPGDKPAALPGVKVANAAAEPPRLESLVKLEALGIEVRFKEIEGALDRGEARMVKRLAALQQKQAKRLAARGAKIVRSEAWGQLAEERVPSDEEAAAIEEELLDLYGLGEEEYGRELTNQGAKPERVEDSEPSRALLAAFALFAAGRLADRMLNAWGAEVLTGARGGLDSGSLADTLAGLSAKLLADLARQGASLAFGLGRTDAGQANAGQVGRELYSTVLDARVCDNCRPYEGQEFAVGEGPPVPNPSCLGGDRCRCVRVPVVDKP